MNTQQQKFDYTEWKLHFLGSCRTADSLAQTKGGVVYRRVMPRPPDSYYATPTNSPYMYNLYVDKRIIMCAGSIIVAQEKLSVRAKG